MLNTIISTDQYFSRMYGSVDEEVSVDIVQYDHESYHLTIAKTLLQGGEVIESTRIYDVGVNIDQIIDLRDMLDAIIIDFNMGKYRGG